MRTEVLLGEHVGVLDVWAWLLRVRLPCVRAHATPHGAGRTPAKPQRNALVASWLPGGGGRAARAE